MHFAVHLNTSVQAQSSTGNGSHQTEIGGFLSGRCCRTRTSIGLGHKIQIQSSLTPANGEYTVYRLDHDLSAELPGGRWHWRVFTQPNNSGAGAVIRTRAAERRAYSFAVSSSFREGRQAGKRAGNHMAAAAPETLTQIFGAKSARSKTGVSSTSTGLAADGVSSAACRKASVVASRPSTVSFA